MPQDSIVDLTFLEENMMGEADFILEVIDLYIDQVPQLLADLRDALDEEDAKRMRFNAHKMRSSAATVGAAELAALLGRIEEGSAQEGPVEELAGLVGRVSELGRASVRELTRARSRYMPEA